MATNRLWTACRPAVGGLAVAAVIGAAVNLLFLASPLYLNQVYDRVLSSGNGWTLALLTLMLTVALVAYAALDALRARILVRVGLALERRLAGPVVLAALGHAAGRTGASGQPVRDLDTVRQGLTGPAMHGLLELPWLPAFALVMLLIHPWMAAFLAASIAVLLGLGVILELRVVGPTRAAGRAQLRAGELLDGLLRGAETVKAMALGPAVQRRWLDDRLVAVGAQAVASGRAGDWSATVRFARFLLQSLLLALGAWLAIGGAISPGSMFAAMIIFGRAVAPVEMLVGVARQLVEVGQAWRRLSALLAAEPEAAPRMPLPAPDGRIAVEAATVTSGEGGPVILRGLSFEVPAGSILAVSGPSGAGKSTLLRLLAGIVRPASGAVRLDRAAIEDWNVEQLGHNVGYLAQGVELLPATVRDTIARYGDADPARVVAAAGAADAHDLILRLPAAYDTPVGPGGHPLSGGQCQRIALARALYDDPRLLLLDEPDSSLDLAGQQALVETLRALRDRGATVVLVSHRPALLAAADRVLELDGGRIVAYGPARCGSEEGDTPRPASAAVSTIGPRLLSPVAGG